jgi:lipopolysaccharide heptosyltransferase II
MKRPRRILLAQTSFLGDVVLTTPLARAIAGAFPEAEVFWLVRPDAAPLVAPLAGAERVLVLDKRGRDRGWRGLLAAARRLREARFDAAIGVQRSLRTALLLALARIPLRVGFQGTPGAWLYHRRVPRVGAHARDRLLGLASGLGAALPAVPPDPALAIDAAAQAEVEALLQRAGVAPHERLLAMAPGSAWATKRWPARHFAAAARALLATGDADRVVLVGGPADRTLAEAIAAELAADPSAARRHGAAVDLTGKTTTAGLVALLARASSLIANDSAPAHIAAALGRPVVALFGPTVPAQGFAPLGPRVRIAERELSCRPCSRHGGERCPIGTHACLVDLPPEQVVAALRELEAEAAASFTAAAARRRGGAE